MFTGLCYGNRLAKITNYENWHTKLIQRCLKAEKYMTKFYDCYKNISILCFCLFLFILFIFCCFVFFFFISYKVGTCPLYGMSGGFGHLFRTSATTQLGRTSLTSSIKIPSSCLRSRYREFSHKPALLAFCKTLCNPCTSSQYSGDEEHHERKEKQPSLHFLLYRAAEDSIYRRLLLLVMSPSCNVGFPSLRKNTILTTSNLQLCFFGTNQTRKEDYIIDRT